MSKIKKVLLRKVKNITKTMLKRKKNMIEYTGRKTKRKKEKLIDYIERKIGKPFYKRKKNTEKGRNWKNYNL